MNKKQYLKLCEICDNILLDPDANTQTIAISWLHIIRAHPALLEKYSGIFLPKLSPLKKLSTRFRSLYYPLFNYALWLRQIARTQLSTNKLGYSSQKLPSHIDVILVSHFLNSSHAG